MGYGFLMSQILISIHALCEEGDAHRSPHGARRENFYPRPLRGGRHHPGAARGLPAVISIHALCEEGDDYCHDMQSITTKFLSTPSARRATCSSFMVFLTSCYFYPRPLRGGRLPGGILRGGGGAISIHALCEEGDPVIYFLFRSLSNFYPRPLRGGRPM